MLGITKIPVFRHSVGGDPKAVAISEIFSNVSLITGDDLRACFKSSELHYPETRQFGVLLKRHDNGGFVSQKQLNLPI